MPGRRDVCTPTALGRLMTAASRSGHGRLRRVATHTDVTLALGLLPLLLVGLASLITFVLGPATGTRAVHSASPAPLHSPWEGLRPGGTWVRTRLSVWTNALLDDPQQPGLVWAGTAHGVWLSPDGGATWQRAGLDGHAILALAATRTGGTVVAGADDGAVYAGAVRRGRDWRWQRISPVLGSDHPIFSLAIAAGKGGHTVLAGTFGALYRGASTRRGWTWRAVAHTGDNAISAITWVPWVAQHAYAAVFAAQTPVLSSQDDGRTWHADSVGLPTALPTQALLALATGARQVLLSTMGAGVWLRSAAGRWHDVSAGLPARHAMPLVAAPGRGSVVLYGGTMGFGVYAKQGVAPWRHLGRGLSGGAYTVLALALTAGPHPVLLAGTALGLFRYVPPA
jgi:hypothetical protein